MDYWSLVDEKLSTGNLSQKESMNRLNGARVSLKHHGTLPSTIDIEAFRVSVTNFFIENCTLVFSVQFDNISLIDLVTCESVKEYLIEATKFYEEGNIKDAVFKIACAFDELLYDYEMQTRSLFGRSPFYFGKSLTFESSFFIGIKDRKIANFIDKVKESIESMQSAIKPLSLGLDYRRARNIDGDLLGQIGSNHNPTEDDYRFCHDFVIESAIKLQEFNFDSLNIKDSES